MGNPPRGSVVPLMSQNCTRLAEKKYQNDCIEGGSMKLTTLVDYYIYCIVYMFISDSWSI